MNAQQAEQQIKRLRIGDDMEIGGYRIVKYGRDNYHLFDVGGRHITGSTRPFFVKCLIALGIVGA